MPEDHKRTLIAIGDWYSDYEPELPDPKNFVRENVNSEQRDMVLQYLRNGQVLHQWMGFSSCRFHCGIPSHKMGNACLTDGKYIWPERLDHYIEEHNVWLPDAFIGHISNNPVKDNRGLGITDDNFGNYDWWKSLQALS